MRLWIVAFASLVGCSSHADAPPSEPCSPVVGDAPFGVVLGGVSVYFPEGRRPHAPVVFYLSGGFFETAAEARAVLSADASASFSLRTFGCATSIEATLQGPTGGIVGRRSWTSVDWQGKVSSGSGAFEACAPRPLLAPKLELPWKVTTPVEEVVIAVDAPLEPSTLATIGAVIAGEPVDVQARAVTGGVAIAPRRGAFPRGGDLFVDLTGVRDAIGRSFTVTLERVKLLNVTSDLRADAFSSPLTYRGDKVTWAAPLRVVLGIGGAAGATSVRVRQRLLCSAPYHEAHAWVISSDGYRTTLPVACADALEERTATLTGSAPWAIVVVQPELPSVYCGHRGSGTAVGYQIGGVSFE
ncbi:MAG: hypothetical protein HYV09_20575 [Deltaproteobacteria bacterium]|nr:hypothetical protein [Deltaproteobacteria bacterium]